jgi:hypothetical protein
MTQDSPLHKFWFFISTEKQWYDVMRECRAWFGKNWCGMSKVRKKLNTNRGHIKIGPVPVWFEVPDPRFATWISVKYSIQVHSDSKFQTTK